MKNVSIYDIAKLTGYSVSTVSKALSGSYKDINEQTKNKIREAAKLHNYHPNQLARAMVNRKSNNIGVIIPNLSNPFFAEVVSGVEAYTYKKGINTILCNTDDDIEKENKYLMSMTKGMIDGAIITPSDQRIDGYQRIVPRDFPIVVLGDTSYSGRQYPYVKTDNKAGAYAGVKYLLDMGHEDILFIGGSEHNVYSQIRLAGYKEALTDHNIPLDSKKLYCKILRSAWGYEAIESALKKNVKFSAVFCANDLVAYGAMNALSAHNLKIPKDISIVGFDDLKVLSENVNLTTVHQAKFGMGKNAAEMLINLINGIPVTSIVTTPKLIVRLSVGQRKD